MPSFFLTIKALIVFVMLIAALYFDLTGKRIPNALTFPAILLGLILHTLIAGVGGLMHSITGLLAGLAIFFIPFALGWLGAGDVKLLGAVGALQGWQFVVSAALLTVPAGGAVALLYLLVTGRFPRVLKKGAGFVLAPFFSLLYYRFSSEMFNRASVYFTIHAPDDQEPSSIPYGVAIAVGVFGLMAINLFPWGGQLINTFPL